MDQVIKFLASQNGRITRIVVGIVLLVLGLFVLTSSTVLEVILVVLGLVMILAGALDYCLIAPLFGKPIKGAALRK